MDFDQDVPVPPMSRAFKKTLSFAVYFCFVAYGFGFSMVAPTMLDVMEQVSTDLHTISYGLVVRSAAYCVGALIVGSLFNIMNRQLGFCISLVGAGASLLMVPWSPNLNTFFMAQGLLGIMCAGIDVAGNAWVLEIWQTEANPWMQGLHFCYALGGFFAPLVAAPFLSADRPENGTAYLLGNGTVPFKTYILVPYSICFLFLLLAGIVLFILYFTSPYVDPLRDLSRGKSTRSSRSESSNASTSEMITSEEASLIPWSPPPYYLATIVFCGGFLLSFYSGIELNSFAYLTPFVVNSRLHLSKQTGALMNSALTLSFTISRALSILVATKLRVVTMLYMNLTIVAIGNCIIMVLGEQDEFYMWVGFIVMGFGFSCVFPGIYSFLEERINVTNTLCGFFMFCSSISTTVNPLIEGNYLESNPMIYIYINVFSLVICFIVFAGLHSTDWRLAKPSLSPGS